MSKTKALHTYSIPVQSQHQQQCLMNSNLLYNMSTTLGNTTSTDHLRSTKPCHWHIKLLLSVVSCINQLIQWASTENNPCTEEIKILSSCKSLNIHNLEGLVTLLEQWKTSQDVSLGLLPLQWDMNCKTVYFCNVLKWLFYYTDIFTQNASPSKAAIHKNSKPICLLYYYTTNA